MKCHVGVDAGSGLVHAITVTPANECDITETVNLIREDDEVVYGDSGYLGVQKRLEIKQNEHLSSIDFRINRRPKSLPKVSDHAIDWERNGILSIANLPFAARSSMYSKLSSANSVIEKSFIAD